MSAEGACFLAGVLACLIFALLAYVFISFGQDESWRNQIADHGCAEFYLDQNHNRQWRWKECGK